MEISAIQSHKNLYTPLETQVYQNFWDDPSTQPRFGMALIPHKCWRPTGIKIVWFWAMKLIAVRSDLTPQPAARVSDPQGATSTAGCGTVKIGVWRIWRGRDRVVFIQSPVSRSVSVRQGVQGHRDCRAVGQCHVWSAGSRSCRWWDAWTEGVFG